MVYCKLDGNCVFVWSYVVSLIYIVKSRVNTYLWINATANSNRNSKINNKDKIFRVYIVLLIRFIKMCPAVILAASRTESVIGRIICLTLSIITIKWDSIIGVPTGTKCLKKFLKDFFKEKKIKQTQKGSAKFSLNISCDVHL